MTKGQHHTAEAKKLMSVASKRRKVKIVPSWVGKNHTSLSKAKISVKLKGRKLSDEHRQNIRKWIHGRSQPWNSHPLSVEHKQKLSLSIRKTRAEKAIKLGIRLSVDVGATEFFDNLNLHNGFHIQHPNVYFKELGYFADGYDPVLHAWFEYDTPCHRSSRNKCRDLKRQTEIIDHFVKIGKPLSVFWRVDATDGKQLMKKVWPI